MDEYGFLSPGGESYTLCGVESVSQTHGIFRGTVQNQPKVTPTPEHTTHPKSTQTPLSPSHSVEVQKKSQAIRAFRLSE